MPTIFFILFLTLQIQISDAYRERIVFVCSYESNDWSGCGVESKGEWEVSTGETATAGTGPQTGGAKNSHNFAFMDANNNPPSARVSMTIKMPFECHHELEFYAYMYGSDVQFLEVDGLNHVNQLWESYYILHRTGPFKTPTYEMPLDLRKSNEASVFPGFTIWHKIFIRWNLYSQFKITAVNTPRNDSKLADIAVDEILVRRIWCKASFIDPDAQENIAEPTVGPERTTTQYGELFRLDVSTIDPASVGQFGRATNGAGDNQWIYGNSQTLFQTSSEMHDVYLLAASAGQADYSFADLTLPDVANGQCLSYYHRLYGTPVMALYVIRVTATNELRVMNKHQAVSDTEITDAWAMILIRLQLAVGDRIVFRAVKQKLSNYNDAGSAQIDDIIVYEIPCEQTPEGAQAIPKDSLEENFSLRSVQAGNTASALNSKDDSKSLVMSILIPLGIIVCVGLVIGIIVVSRKKSRQDDYAGYDPNAPLDPNAPYDPNAQYDPNAPADPNTQQGY